jgi:uncharacterized protein (DUF111 family)
MLEVQYVSLPVMRIKATGYGAGGRELPGEVNLLRLLVGEEEVDEQTASEPIAVIETVIDDSSPQVIAYACDLLFEAGAWDVYRTAVQMKKGRTGALLTVLCRPDLVSTLREILFRENTTIGLRWRLENKHLLARESIEVETELGPVRIKIARWPSGKVANASPEFEDCRLLATLHRQPLKSVMREAMRAYAAANKLTSNHPADSSKDSI